MKLTTLLLTVFALALTACDKKPDEPFVPTPRDMSSSALPEGHPPVNANAPEMTSSDSSEAVQLHQATVISSIDIPQFTYLEVKQNNQTRWLAASTIAAKKGDVIQFDTGSTLSDFHSKALDRTFASISFVNRVTIVKGK